MDRLPRNWWKQWAKYHCPEPKRMLLDFYDWYQLWSSFTHPSGEPFFTQNSYNTFKHECGYIIPGHLSDLPGMPAYTVVRKLPDGREVYRSLRTSSALEGIHHELRSAQDSKTKHQGPRRSNAALRLWQFRTTITAAIKAGKIPYIGHFDIHLRYRLMDIVKGTPHENTLTEVLGWIHVDLSIAPTVPRGCDCSSLLPWDPNTPSHTSKEIKFDAHSIRVDSGNVWTWAHF